MQSAERITPDPSQDIHLTYHAAQASLLRSYPGVRIKSLAKGRRWGFTKAVGQYVVQKLSEGIGPILWVDTTYSNIDRYVERLIEPCYANIPNSGFKWRKQLKELSYKKDVRADFRSAEHPENIEGYGYKIIIINEAGIVLKNTDLWFKSIMPMMIDYGDDVEVIIGGTPKGKKNPRRKKQDGKDEHVFWEIFQKGNPESKHYNPRYKSFQYSSYTNPFVDNGAIADTEKDLGELLAKQEIYGRFIDTAGGGIFKWEDFKFYTIFPHNFIFVLQSWDTAFETNQVNDYSVCTTWGLTKNGIYLLDYWRGRVEFPDLYKIAIELYKKWKKRTGVNDVIIEKKASGHSLIQTLRRNTRLTINPFDPGDKDKIARAHAVTPSIRAGRVFLPADAEYLEEIKSELVEFPNDAHDDIVDSFTQALLYLSDYEEGDDGIMLI